MIETEKPTAVVDGMLNMGTLTMSMTMTWLVRDEQPMRMGTEKNAVTRNEGKRDGKRKKQKRDAA